MSDETWDTIKKRREAKLRSEAGRVDDRELARADAKDIIILESLVHAKVQNFSPVFYRT